MSEIITMAHGAGGETMREFLAGEIAALYEGAPEWDDAAVVAGGERIAITTDSFVVSPLIFPGGDIGKLAACGTINDLAMRGARPMYLTVGLIVEEGLPLETLRTVLGSLGDTCRGADVRIAAGDTKVVERGSGDGLFINTTGVGFIETDPPPGIHRVAPGDAILVSGFMGDHGVAILAAREDLPLRTQVRSDCAALHGLAQALLEVGGSDVHAMRDPTRGGLAAVLNEAARDAGVGISVDESAIPVRPEVRGACDLLGFDPLHLANEGKLVAFVAPDSAEGLLGIAHSHPLGANCAIIGDVTDKTPQRVSVRTSLGTTRVLGMPTGELLPRIC